jgi:hypothetical protein
MPLPSRSTSADLPVVLENHTAPLFLLCFRPRRKQDPVAFALVIALLVVMYEILLQFSRQRRFSKQGRPRQTFFFDRSSPSVPHASSDLGSLLAIEADSLFPSWSVLETIRRTSRHGHAADSTAFPYLSRSLTYSHAGLVQIYVLIVSPSTRDVRVDDSLLKCKGFPLDTRGGLKYTVRILDSASLALPSRFAGGTRLSIGRDRPRFPGKRQNPGGMSWQPP